jgi:hypothetical protein
MVASSQMIFAAPWWHETKYEKMVKDSLGFRPTIEDRVERLICGTSRFLRRRHSSKKRRRGANGFPS